MLETARDQDDLAEEKRNSMDAKFAKMHEMHQQQMYHSQQMQTQYEANTRMIMQQMAHMQSAMKQSDLLTTMGVKDSGLDVGTRNFGSAGVVLGVPCVALTNDGDCSVVQAAILSGAVGVAQCDAGRNGRGGTQACVSADLVPLAARHFTVWPLAARHFSVQPLAAGRSSCK